jgi:hypothetical protein
VARQEKAVDPAAGPLQAFAYELRKVRADAGSPTYRVLAKAAGYSAATLSEAAGGVRRPTLDVLLAYVGACQGDVERWRDRWQELQTALDGVAPPAAGDTGPVAPDAPAWDPTLPAPASIDPPHAGPPHADPLQTDPLQADPLQAAPAPAWLGVRLEPLWRWKLAVFGVLAALVIGAVGAFAIGDPDHPSRTAAAGPAGDAPGCPPKVAKPAFTAVTYGAGARVHSGAARDAPEITTIPAGCTVGFVGYCLGEKIHDTTGGSPDLRWFELPGGGVVTSGIVHGNPPAGLAPSPCPDDRPGPAAIRLAVAADPDLPGALRLSATGTRLDIVGFAALYGPDAPRRWRQVGFTEQSVGQPGFRVPWKLEPSAAGPDPVLVVAAACLGGDGPTAVVDARSTAPGDPEVVLSPADRAAAAAAACAYPA